MKRKLLSLHEQVQFICLRQNLHHDLLHKGYAPDDRAAFALANNDALRTVYRARKREGSGKGAKATARAFARPDLDELIRGCLDRGESTTDYVAAWAEEFGLDRSTVYRHIERIKLQK